MNNFSCECDIGVDYLKEIGDAGLEYLRKTGKLDYVKSEFPNYFLDVVFGIGVAVKTHEESKLMKERLGENYQTLKSIIDGALKYANN